MNNTDLSPMSSLAFTPHHGASHSQTPRRSLSFSPSLSDTPQSCHDGSLGEGFLHDSVSSETGVLEDVVFASPHKPSAPEYFETTSQDSGYSGSGKKVKDDW